MIILILLLLVPILKINILSTIFVRCVSIRLWFHIGTVLYSTFSFALFVLLYIPFFHRLATSASLCEIVPAFLKVLLQCIFNHALGSLYGIQRSNYPCYYCDLFEFLCCPLPGYACLYFLCRSLLKSITKIVEI